MKEVNVFRGWRKWVWGVLIGAAFLVAPGLSSAASPVSNPGFETGTAASWTASGGASVVYGGHGGKYSAKHTGLAGFEQTVSGLSPNTAYKLQAWLKSDGANSIALGAKSFGGSQVTAVASSASWTKVSVNFTTGAASTTATIFTFLAAGTAYADELTVYPTSSQTLALTSPTASQTVSGTHNITWTAGGDWSDDKLTIEYTTESSINSDTVWYPLAVDLNPDLQTFAWDTRKVSGLLGDDISTSKIRLKATDGAPSTSSASFNINNYGTGTPTITMTGPASSSTIGGTSPVTWTIGGDWSGKSVNIYYSSDGVNFTALATGLSPLDGSYALDTTRYGNGMWDMITVNDENFAIAGYATDVTINNPTGIKLISPTTNERWSATEDIRWKTLGSWAGKTVRIDYSPDNGTNWHSIATGLSPSSGTYSWNTANATNTYGPNATYRFRVQDNTQTLTDQSGSMTIDNTHIGTKTFDQGFTVFPYDRTEASQTVRNEFLNRHGNLTTVWEDGSLPWAAALTSDDVDDYPQGFQDHWSEIKDDIIGDSTNKVFLSVNPGRGGKLAKLWGDYANMDLPAPWSGYTLDHADTITAYTNLLRAGIAYFGANKVAYVAIGFELDGVYAKGGATAWRQYMKLQKKVYETLKSEYPAIAFLATVTGPHVHMSNSELLMAGLFNYSDAWGFSSYPYSVEPYTDAYSSVGAPYPSNYYDDFVDLAAKYGKRIAFGESGYIHENQSIPSWNISSVSDEALQNYHINRILKDSNEGNALFVNNWASIDLDQLWQQEPAGMTRDLYALWRDIGLRQYNDATGTWTTFSAESSWDAWLVKPNRTTGDTTAPGNVTGFSASDSTAGTISLSWTKPAGADSVRILRKAGSYSTGNTDGTVVYSGPGTSYSDISAPTGTTYYYTAWARDESFNWSNGNVSGARDTGYANADATAPANVAQFSASDYRYGVLLNWNNPSDADFARVKILRKTGSYSTTSTDGTQVYIGSGESFIDTSATAGTVYYYSAWATDETGSNWSSGAVSGARDTGVGAVQLFFDDFEDGNLNKWDGSGATDWRIPNDQDPAFDYRAGYRSVLAESGDTALISDDINTTGASRITVRFYYNNHGLSSGDGVQIYFYNGSGYVAMLNIGGHSADRYQWNYVEVTTTNASFFKSNFKIKIDATGIGSGKSLYIDSVSVDKL